MRILLVEDDPDIQTITSLALDSIGGYTVEVCGSARDALDMAIAFRPDLILLDVMMPGMDGIDALQALRGIPETAAVPVVFLTARVQPSEVARYRRLGALAVIPKPFEPTALVETIAQLWSRHLSRTPDRRTRELDALRRSYRAELPDKLRLIAEEVAALQGGPWDRERLQSLYDQIHRLAGSAAVYGFDEVSRAAGELELWTLAALAGTALEERPAELGDLLGALDRAFRASEGGERAGGSRRNPRPSRC
jgi:two-component system OmpR family response regulator